MSLTTEEYALYRMINKQVKHYGFRIIVPPMRNYTEFRRDNYNFYFLDDIIGNIIHSWNDEFHKHERSAELDPKVRIRFNNRFKIYEFMMNVSYFTDIAREIREYVAVTYGSQFLQQLYRSNEIYF